MLVIVDMSGKLKMNAENSRFQPIQAGDLRRLLICLSVYMGIFPNGACAEDVDFNRDIRPILSDRCFLCHGPDDGSNDSGLRLDLAEHATAEAPSGDGRAIVPGDAGASLALQRILSDDEDLVMPPPDSNLTVTDAEKTLLRKWIQQGAKYAGHWAFEPVPATVVVPTVDEPDWCQNPIDAFVLAKTEAAGMQTSPEADRWRWLRRVTFDLTGLPPTPDEIQAFEKDGAENAYETVVDRLLGSTHFGEHMAVAWLDAARYADSYGYQSDKLNTQWPYRDWVVRAFNDNLPYDSFLTWQLAGDLLPNPTRDQKLATAFNRIHRLNNEGGAVFEEWRIENVADRVHTFGTAVLGLTMECCRCHDHKYDPIPMRDYYSLSAFFNSIDESGVYDRTQKVPCPSLLLPTPQQSAKLDEATKSVERSGIAYENAVADSKERFHDWKQQQAGENLIPDLRLALAFDRNFDNSLKEIYHPSQSDRSWAPAPDLIDVTDSPLARLEPTQAFDGGEGEAIPSRRAMILDGERGATTHGIEPFDRWTPFTVAISLKETKRSSQRSLIAHHTRGTDCGYNGWDLTIVDGYLESRMYRVWPGNAIGVRTVDPIPANVWHQIAATYNGSSDATGLQLLLNGAPLKTTVLRNNVRKSANVKVDHGGEFVVGQRFRARGLDGGLVDDVRIYTRALTIRELKHLASGAPIELTQEYFASAIDEKARAALEALTVARKALVMAEEQMNEIPVMDEMNEPRPAHVLARGAYDAPTSDETLVTRDTLSQISFPFPDEAPRNRLGLAQWAVDPGNPLTARVAVNRFWGNFFAEPLVRTPENFGSQGELPTHPTLLDWLARDFMNSGWDVKRLCRNIVLSATYRQNSSASKSRQEADPTNRLLARGPAYRLSAEQIRDLVLASSGLLNFEAGGPPVSPYQPGGDLWRESNGMSPPYEQSAGRALYRRSLYSVWKRTAPLPNMMAFDTTSREVCTVKRARTNTPLQALVLLNDVQFVEACRKLAERVSATVPADADQVTAAFLSLTGRNPDELEHSTLVSLLEAERTHFKERSDDAVKLLALGDAKSADGCDAASLAALTTVCQAILNLDATIWKR